MTAMETIYVAVEALDAQDLAVKIHVKAAKSRENYTTATQGLKYSTKLMEFK